MSWNIGNSRNLYLNMKNKLGLYHVVLSDQDQKFSLTILEAQNLPKLKNLDIDSQISSFEWTLHNGRRRVLILYDSVKIVIAQCNRKGTQWIKGKTIEMFTIEYEKLLENIPLILCYIETFTKKCIAINEDTIRDSVVKDGRIDIDESFHAITQS